MIAPSTKTARLRCATVAEVKRGTPNPYRVACYLSVGLSPEKFVARRREREAHQQRELLGSIADFDPTLGKAAALRDREILRALAQLPPSKRRFVFKRQAAQKQMYEQAQRNRQSAISSIAPTLSRAA